MDRDGARVGSLLVIDRASEIDRAGGRSQNPIMLDKWLGYVFALIVLALIVSM